MNTLIICPFFKKNHINFGRSLEAEIAEFENLGQALPQITIKEIISIELKLIKAGKLFGSGKIREISDINSKFHIGLVLVDFTLSPIQQRNLEKSWHVKVLDRNGLILEIFAMRANTREGVLQVELASLDYQKTRLVRSWTHLERQRGGIGFMGGPGETQIESDRRALSDKIVRIKSSLQRVIKTRSLHRSNRQRKSIPTVALIGYTNTGKSSLFNVLTNSDVLVKDMLFATLDPTARSVELLGTGGKSIIMSDTVGFISNLPTQLIAAFKATLEEVINADLIIHVQDVSNEHSKVQEIEVLKTLKELDWRDRKQPKIINVFNKIDRLSSEELALLKLRCSNSTNKVLVSAKSGAGIEYLRNQIKLNLMPKQSTEVIFIRYNDTKKRSWLFNEKIVISEHSDDVGFHVKVRWSKNKKNQFVSRFF